MTPNQCWDLLSKNREFLPVAADYFEEQQDDIHHTLRWMLRNNKFPSYEITGNWTGNNTRIWTWWFLTAPINPETLSLDFQAMKSPHHPSKYSYRDFLVFEASIRALHEVLYEVGELVADSGTGAIVVANGS